MNRRRFFLAGAAALAGCALPARPRPRVLVVGAGFGGATVAKYLRLWDPGIDVLLVDRQREFVSCPISNLVLGGQAALADITHGYEGLRKHGVHVLEGEAVAVDPHKRTVTFGRGSALVYDRLVLAPGIDFVFDEIEGYAGQERILHAWKAGPQTVALRQQLEAMPDGGVYLLSVPPAPYRCPPGPYERASMIAAYFKQAKPRSKVVVLDANPDVISKPGLFKAAWKELYGGILEYRGNAKVVAVDAKTMTVRTEFDSVKGDVLNIVPPQRAGDIAVKAGLLPAKGRWCDVDWRTMESKVAPGVHVLGDATLSAPGMPKSASMANNHAKIAAAAIVELLNERTPQPPKIINTCYSFVAAKQAIRVSSVHEWDGSTLQPVKGAGGVSAARSEAEASFAWNWARTIWADSLG